MEAFVDDFYIGDVFRALLALFLLVLAFLGVSYVSKQLLLIFSSLRAYVLIIRVGISTIKSFGLKNFCSHFTSKSRFYCSALVKLASILRARSRFSFWVRPGFYLRSRLNKIQLSFSASLSSSTAS